MCSSKMKPRLRAEWVQFREELCILASCCLRPMRRNSVLEEFRVSRLAVIQEEICCKMSCRRLRLEWKSGGRKERKSCVSSACRWWFREIDEIRVGRGVVYMMKSNGHKTEPWATPKREVCEENRCQRNWPGMNEMTGMTWTNLGQCHKFQTKRTDKKEGYYDRWCQKHQRGLVGRDMILVLLSCCEPIALMRWSWM